MLISPYKRARVTISSLVNGADLIDMIKFLMFLLRHNVKRKYERIPRYNFTFFNKSSCCN